MESHRLPGAFQGSFPKSGRQEQLQQLEYQNLQLEHSNSQTQVQYQRVQHQEQQEFEPQQKLQQEMQPQQELQSQKNSTQERNSEILPLIEELLAASNFYSEVPVSLPSTNQVFKDIQMNSQTSRNQFIDRNKENNSGCNVPDYPKTSISDGSNLFSSIDTDIWASLLPYSVPQENSDFSGTAQSNSRIFDSSNLTIPVSNCFPAIQSYFRDNILESNQVSGSWKVPETSNDSSSGSYIQDSSKSRLQTNVTESLATSSHQRLQKDLEELMRFTDVSEFPPAQKRRGRPPSSKKPNNRRNQNSAKFKKVPKPGILQQLSGYDRQPPAYSQLPLVYQQSSKYYQERPAYPQQPVEYPQQSPVYHQQSSFFSLQLPGYLNQLPVGTSKHQLAGYTQLRGSNQQLSRCMQQYQEHVQQFSVYPQQPPGYARSISRNIQHHTNHQQPNYPQQLSGYVSEYVQHTSEYHRQLSHSVAQFPGYVHRPNSGVEHLPGFIQQFPTSVQHVSSQIGHLQINQSFENPQQLISTNFCGFQNQESPHFISEVPFRIPAPRASRSWHIPEILPNSETITEFSNLKNLKDTNAEPMEASLAISLCKETSALTNPANNKEQKYNFSLFPIPSSCAISELKCTLQEANKLEESKQTNMFNQLINDNQPHVTNELKDSKKLELTNESQHNDISEASHQKTSDLLKIAVADDIATVKTARSKDLQNPDTAVHLPASYEETRSWLLDSPPPPLVIDFPEDIKKKK